MSKPVTTIYYHTSQANNVLEMHFCRGLGVKEALWEMCKTILSGNPYWFIVPPVFDFNLSDSMYPRNSYYGWGINSHIPDFSSGVGVYHDYDTRRDSTKVHLFAFGYKTWGYVEGNPYGDPFVWNLLRYPKEHGFCMERF